MGVRRATPRRLALPAASTAASTALSSSAPPPPPLLLLLLLLLPAPCRAHDDGVNGMWPVLGVALATFLCLSICFSCCKVYFIRRRMEDEAAASRARAARGNLTSPYIVVAMISRDYERQPRGRPGERALRPFVAGRPPRLPLDLGAGDLLPPPSYQEATAAPPSVFPDEPPPRYSVASEAGRATPVARADVTTRSAPQQQQQDGGAVRV